MSDHEDEDGIVQRLLKWLFLMGIAGAVLTGISYLGARSTTGQLLGSNPPLRGRSTTLAAATDLPDTPIAWVFTYRASNLPGVSRAQIYVSPTGKVIATRPRNLEAMLELWELSKLPEELR